MSLSASPSHNIIDFDNFQSKIILQTPIAITLLIGADFTVHIANEKMLEIWQKKEDEVLNRPIFEIFPELKSQAIFQILHEVYQTGVTLKTNEFEIQFVRNGVLDTAWFDITYEPTRKDSGEIEGIMAIASEVTSQVLARKKIESSEKALKEMADAMPRLAWIAESRELLETTLNHVPSAIYHLDKNGKFLYVNEIAAKQMGYDSAKEVLAVENVYEFRDRLDEHFMLFDENGKILQADESCTSITLKTGKPAEVVVKFVSKKDNSSFWLLTKSVPLHNNKGELTNVFTCCTDITAQKKSEEALKYRKALLEAQNEAIPDATLIVDLKGNMISCNRKFARIWGMPDDIIQRKDDDAALTFAMTNVINPEGFIERVKYCYAHPDIKAHDEVLFRDGRLIDRHGNAVVGEDGTQYGWAWHFRDITEEKRSAAVIKESEEKYRGLFETMDQGFCIIEVIFDADLKAIDYRFLECNAVFENHTGFANVMGKTIIEIVPNIEKIWIENYGEVVLTGNPIRFINESEAMNRWFEVYAFRLGDAQNNKVAILFTDISERKKSEQALKSSEERFRILTETIPQMIWMTDQEGNTEYTSSQWIKYAGIMPSSQYWVNMAHPEDIQSTLKDWAKSVATGEVFVTESRLKNKDGEYRWHVSKGIPLKDDAGNIMKWIGSVTDIHEQKMKEQKKDEFISIASHEMKTPLTSAKAYLQLLEMSLDENNNALLYAQKASNAIERLNKLISELLDASKIQHGKLNYNNTLFNLEEMIDNTIENVQYSYATHKIIKTGVSTKHFWGDRDRLQQVVINLLTNAIKYSPKAKEVIVNVEEHNNHVKISVTDKGIGMSEKHLEKVFDRYYRVEEHAIHFQGLGIGLYISYDIVKRHQGNMWVESTPEQGSTFYFTLPFNTNQNHPNADEKEYPNL